MKSDRTRQLPRVGAVPGQLKPGCLLTPQPSHNLTSPFLALLPFLYAPGRPAKPLLQQTWGPCCHLHSPGPLAGTHGDGKHHDMHKLAPLWGRSPSAATGQLRPCLSPPYSRFSAPTAPQGHPAGPPQAATKAISVLPSSPGRLPRHLPEISCGQRVAEVNAVAIMNALLVCLFSAEILSARRSDNNMLLSSFWIM